MDMPAPRVSVAIVDDEESVRVSLRRLCHALGLDATVFASGLELLDFLEAGGGRRTACCSTHTCRT